MVTLGENMNTVGDLREALKQVPDSAFLNIGNQIYGFSVDEIHYDGLSVALETKEEGVFEPITDGKIAAAKQCLIDNGIDADEAETVLQALGYVLLNVELFPEEIKGKDMPFELYAGYKADGSYTQISSFSWREDTAKKSSFNRILAKHCDIYDQSLMKQVVDAIQRPCNLENVKEMWVTTIPGTKEVAVSLILDEKRRVNYPLYGDDAKKIFDLVNSWPVYSLEKEILTKPSLSDQIQSASVRSFEDRSTSDVKIKNPEPER